MTIAPDMIMDDIFEDDDNSNETLELLKFFKNHGTPLTNEQIQAMYLLKENDCNDLAEYLFMMKQYTTRKKVFFDVLSKLTMADRIKGNAKLSHLMKANANPANTALKPEDLQAKGMSRREIDSY